MLIFSILALLHLSKRCDNIKTNERKASEMNFHMHTETKFKILCGLNFVTQCGYFANDSGVKRLQL